MKIHEKDRQKIIDEISECQKRVAQTLVPTILALGLISIANPDNIRDITLGCAFAVLFSSSMYVASLTYKIFRNAMFLKVFEPEDKNADSICWEDALSKYRSKFTPPLIIHSETTATSAIYTVLSITYFFMFFNTNPWWASFCTLVLLFVSLSMVFLFKSHETHCQYWNDIKSSYNSKLMDEIE